MSQVSRYLVLCVLLVLRSNICLGFQWNEPITPRMRVNYLRTDDDAVFSFLGNQTHNDHFKLLQTEGHSLLIGARNVVYNLSLADLSENQEQRITWASSKRDRDLCLIKGKSEDECENYIRVLAHTGSDSWLVCGTNSFNPKCRQYSSKSSLVVDKNTSDISNLAVGSASQPIDGLESQSLRIDKEFPAKGLCPPDPNHNSTAIFTGGQLYSGTVADFSGSDALIFKANIRTEQYDLKQLNSPSFVSSVEDEDYVYFFFREYAVEYINCGKSVFSRVARVCKHDRGSSHKFQHRWTSFLKARLNCSVPGSIPFYFNEIQSSTDFIPVAQGLDQVIFGIFTTPENAISGSAVCSFRLSDIRHAFDQGPFKGQASDNANWLPIKMEDLPGQQRPGQCVNDSRQLPETTLNFMRRYSLMDESVHNAKTRMKPSHSHASFDYGDPLFVKTALNERLTVIAVDPQIRSPYGLVHDVIYVGTSRGKVLKLVSALDVNSDKRKAVMIEELQLFPYHVPVRQIRVLPVTSSSSKRLFALSDFEVKSVPLHRCSSPQLQSCSACVALQDPHCAWNLQLNRCVDQTTFENTESSLLIQNIFRGKHRACFSENSQTAADLDNNLWAESNEDLVTYDEAVAAKSSMNSGKVPRMLDIVIDLQDEDEEEQREHEDRFPIYEDAVQMDSSRDKSYSTSTFITALLLTALAAILVGFVIGWLASKRCAREDYKSCGHRYLEEQSSMNSKHQESSALNEPSYSAPPCNNQTPLNVNDSKNNLLALNKNINSKTNNDLMEKKNLILCSSGGHLESGLGSSTVLEVNVNGDKLTSVAHLELTSRSNNVGGVTGTGGGGTLCRKAYV